MALKNSAVFRFILDIRDFLIKGRQASEVLNKISGNSQKASVDVEKLSGSFEKTGKSATAAAVNFQTATQGMLNLTTAGVQTFTSFSNLDRAANRLAQAQVGLARAQDLFNNKQLRLNELRRNGLGDTAKAVQLEKELGTARADLLVKTDKLRIEEGALTDIQLLFATNVANVMISSLQTIKTLKDLNIAATIKATAVQKLQNLGIMTAATQQITYRDAIRSTTFATQAQVNMNRLLTLSIPVVGVALTALTVGVQAYNENWGGFKDGLQAVFPLLKDHKDLLRQTQEEMAGANGEFTKYNDSLSDSGKELDRLPMRYDLLINRIKKLREETSLSATQTEKLNREIGKIPADFRSPSNGGLLATGGTFQQIGGPTRITSNVVRTEGDASFTAKGISSSSIAIPTTNDFIKMASAGVLTTVNPKTISKAKKEFAISNNQRLVFERGGLYDLFNILDPKTTGSAFIQQYMNAWGENFSIVGKGLSKGISMTKTSMDKSIFETNFALRRAFGDLSFQLPYIEDVYKFIGGSFPTISDAKKFVGINQTHTNRLQNALAFQANKDKNVNFFDTIIHPWDKKIPRRLGFSSSISRGGKTVLGELGRESILRTGTPEEQLEFLLREGASMGFNIETEEDAFRYLLAIEEETDFLKGFTAVYSDPNIPIAGEIINTLSQTEFFEKTATERAERFKKAELFKIAQEAKFRREAKLIAEAAAFGISTDDLIFRRGIGGSKTRPGLGYDILRYGLDPTEQQMKFLESAGRLARFQYGNPTGPISTDYAYEFVPKKVKEAWAIRDEIKKGNLNSIDNWIENTAHGRLVKAAFGARNMFGPGHRLGGFKFGSAGGTLNMAYKGLILSKDDPLLKDTSNMGETQLAVFMETGVDIGGVAETIGKKEALRIAHLDKQMATFANTTGGFSSAAISYLNMVGKTNEWGQMATMNDLMSSKHSFANVAAGRVMGSTNYFGSGFFKSSGATAAYQVARGSIKVPSWVAEQQRRKDGFTNGIGVVYQNAINRFFGSGRTQTLGRSASRAARNLNLNSSYMDMAKTLGIFDDPNFAERLLQMDNNINASETDAVNKANNLYHTVNQASREYLSLQQRTLANVGIDIDLSNVRTFSHWQGFAGGKRHAIYDYYTPAEMAADMIADMGAQGLGLNISMDRGFLNNMALLAKYNTTNFNNTAILDASISRLNISRKQAFDIRLDYKRGDNELRDRLRWRQRLDGMSTGNVVI